MAQYGMIAIYAVLGLLGLIAAIAGIRTRSVRVKQMAQFAATDNWDYLGDSTGPILESLRFCWPFSEMTPNLSLLGFNENANSEETRNCFCTRKPDGNDYYTFDYYLTIGQGRDRQTESFGVILARVPFDFTMPVQITPETLFSRLGERLGEGHIDFESVDFNRRYRTICDDKKFAFDIVTPQLIEHLLRIEPMTWTFFSTFVAVISSNFFLPDEIRRTTVDISELLKTIPDYVRKEIGIAPSWQSPMDGLAVGGFLDANL